MDCKRWVARVEITSAIIVTGLLAGCSGYRTYDRSDVIEWPPNAATVQQYVKVGDRVRALGADRTTVSGVVDSLGRDGLVVSGVPVEYSSISSLQVRGFLWEPTAVLAGSAMFVILTMGRHGEFSPDAAAAGAK